ncbi:MAG: DoxX family membrane protein [Candidatus Latescibacteria bacterium]|nr:DoxX family membrane protein [Candidatus Latescibacterota bacterium]
MENVSGTVQQKKNSFSTLQFTSLVILRLLIGWHFLYEGFAKVFNPNWSAASFLLDSKGIFSGIFNAMAMNPTILTFVNISNKLGLIAIGLGLMLGALTRTASFAAILLLLLYYFATPPFIGYTYSVPMEGSYMIVNKNLIEAWALVIVIMFPTSHVLGMDRLIFPSKNK